MFLHTGHRLVSVYIKLDVSEHRSPRWAPEKASNQDVCFGPVTKMTLSRLYSCFMSPYLSANVCFCLIAHWKRPRETPGRKNSFGWTSFILQKCGCACTAHIDVFKCIYFCIFYSLYMMKPLWMKPESNSVNQTPLTFMWYKPYPAS